MGIMGKRLIINICFIRLPRRILIGNTQSSQIPTKCHMNAKPTKHPLISKNKYKACYIGTKKKKEIIRHGKK